MFGVYTDDDGDGVVDEDCAQPNPGILYMGL